MATLLHKALRTLCFNSGWKYAVFWKLKHHARMYGTSCTMLTWEDAYYDNHEQCDPSENMYSSEIGSNLSDRQVQDPLGLALVKMSHRTYSLGEGIIGEVAVTGKHMWIFADAHVSTSCAPLEQLDGWQTQFLAGIKTVILVAVVPHGVVQMGSLNEIPEDLNLVTHIRDTFFALEDSSMGSLTRFIVGSSTCLSDVSTISGSGDSCGYKSNLGRHMKEDNVIIRTPTVSSTKTVEAASKDGGLELSMSGGDELANLLQSRPEIYLLEQQKQVQTKLHTDRAFEGETSCSYLEVGAEDHDNSSSRNYFNNINFYNVTLPADVSGVDVTYLQSDHLDSTACNNQSGKLCIGEPFDMQTLNVLEDTDFQTEFSNSEVWNMPYNFSAGCELYEVLGPAFQKQSICSNWEAEKTATDTATAMPEKMDSTSMLKADSGFEHLLEAVVANVCRSGDDVKSETSLCQSVKSLSTIKKMPQPKLTVDSAGYSFDQSIVEKSTLHCLSSESCGMSSSMGFSSRSRGTFSEQLDSAQEPAKPNKKRARPGESCRPRPRDRQLIQDRIKELRELVPNGSKCSIDSLLERTIKHMLFMQNITKHADKLNKCSESKLPSKEAVVGGLPSYDQGSSWVMEVGSYLKVCAMMVENINMNGQMQIKMLCEECSHFLEIAEAIRSLGLTILKGLTDTCGEKTWMCFVVEGQNNRSVHRMDILWSLVQILQSKTTDMTVP